MTDDDQSVFEANKDLTINSLTVLVDRLGGKVTITQAELDLLVVDKTVIALGFDEDKNALTITSRKGVPL